MKIAGSQDYMRKNKDRLITRVKPETSTEKKKKKKHKRIQEKTEILKTWNRRLVDTENKLQILVM